jgi:endoglucanase
LLLLTGCLKPAEITGGQSPSVKKMMHGEAPVPRVLVDQVGYLPARPKIATVRSDAPAPLDWALLDAAGRPVARGKSTPLGRDAPSGDAVHLVDFSSWRQPGDGFVLEVAGERSHPFPIRADLYHKLKLDALAYFYQNRSGIPIEMPYAGDAKWTRPAGHLGDREVPCIQPGACGYKLDVSGGWYDAGDHGKYVVNAGIAVWTLLDLWERMARFGRPGAAADFADGKLAIPERGNGVPDLLDEARWELEWMLKMQAPDGAPLAGMAHHKIHDRAWTQLATAPHQDHQPRVLFPPSTAATLNLAAVAAQGARIWKAIDPAFAARCRAAAVKAYAAAEAHPAVLVHAPVQSAGGGPYDDLHVDDEFYWAAAELFITTGEERYRAAIERSRYYLALPTSADPGDKPGGAPTTMSWQGTAALGSLSLAVVTEAGLAAGARATLRDHLLTAADFYLGVIGEQGYRSPLRPGAKGYPWGSSSNVVNNLMIVALAYDLTHDRRYLDAVAVGMDYLFGRNPMDKCYVSGYGARPLVHPHHRFWAEQYNFRFPPPPPGALAGGPNSGIEDPTAKAAGLRGCAPQKCYVDHIEAWSLNEVAINWNAPLVWVAAFLDEEGNQ